MSSWAGNFKNLITVLSVVCFGTTAFAAPKMQTATATTWEKFNIQTLQQEKRDFRDGLSYIISGSLALVGGVLGTNVTTDPLEKGIYSAFQTIGIASVGYGAYTWRIGGEERTLRAALEDSDLSPMARSQFLDAYQKKRAERERQERRIKAVTHGLIAALNIYNATQQEQDSVKTALYFVGGVNLLASISFTFEF